MVAERADVSTATVSNVLNGKPVSPAFVARVRAAVEELGYVADPHASRLRSGRHALAAVVVPDLANPMFGAFVSTLEGVARQDGYDLLVMSSANDPDEETERLRTIRAWRPAGLVVIPCDGALAARLPRGGNPPIVVADRIPDAAEFDLVAVDNGRAAARVAAHLSGQGYGSCLVVGTSLAISNVRERWEGTATAAGPMKVRLLEVGLDVKGAERLLRGAFGGRSRPDAVFALDHGTTLVAYQLLIELGLRVPDDLGFASFDEAEWMRLVQPPITAVRQPVESMAAEAWRQLLRRMKEHEVAPVSVRLECAVALRGSTRRQPRPGSAAA